MENSVLHIINLTLSADYLIDCAWAIMVHTLWLKPASKQGVDYSDKYDQDLEQWIGCCQDH